MNRNRKGVMPEITRAMYKDIKISRNTTGSSLQDFALICTVMDSRTEKQLSLAWISRKCMLL